MFSSAKKIWLALLIGCLFAACGGSDEEDSITSSSGKGDDDWLAPTGPGSSGGDDWLNPGSTTGSDDWLNPNDLWSTKCYYHSYDKATCDFACTTLPDKPTRCTGNDNLGYCCPKPSGTIVKPTQCQGGLSFSSCVDACSKISGQCLEMTNCKDNFGQQLYVCKPLGSTTGSTSNCQSLSPSETICKWQCSTACYPYQKGSAMFYFCNDGRPLCTP